MSASASRSSAACSGASSIADKRAKEPIGEAASDHRADLRHLARGAEPVEPRRQRLLQRRRDRLDAALLAALQQEPRHLLDEQRHAAGARGDIIHDLARQRMAGRKLRHHLPHLRAIERRQARSCRDASACSRAAGTPAASSPR